MTKTFRIWAFGFRYCLVFSASARDELGRVDLGFNSWLNYAQLFKVIHVVPSARMREVRSDETVLHLRG